MLLSIGMIVKNESKNLRKCLEGIKPILDNVDSQLIIADTGSTDDTVEIAREFTNFVYSIEWRDDFAWARNTTLARAKGKWYMFLDADEFFEDTQDIIDFFNSGDYKNYKSASHQINNVLSSSGVGSSVASVRLVRKDKDTKFYGRIHEGLNSKQPIKALDSYSMHGGYLFTSSDDDKEAKERKHERNLKPMLEEYEKDPSNVRIIAHIVKQYNFIGDWEKSKEFLDIGYAVCPKEHGYYNFYRKQYVLYYNRVGEHEKALEEIKDYFEVMNVLCTSSIDMRMYEATALDKLNRPDDAFRARREALNLIEEYKKGNLDTTDMRYDSSVGTFPKTRITLISGVFVYYLKKDDFDGAIGFANEYGSNFKSIIVTYLKLFVNKADSAKIVMLYDYFAKRYGIGTKEYSVCIEEIEKYAATSKLKPEITKTMAENYPGDTNDDYLKLEKLRYMSFKGNSDVYKLLDYFINSSVVYEELYADVITVAMNFDVDFSPFVDRLEANSLPRFVKKMTAFNDNMAAAALDFANRSTWPDRCGSVKANRFMFILAHKLMLDENDEETKTALFEMYVTTYNNYLCRIYSGEVLTKTNIDILPDSARFTYYAHIAYERKYLKDYGGFVSNIKTALQQDTGMKDVVKIVLKYVSEELKTNPHQTEPQNPVLVKTSPRSQLDKETEVLKSLIIDLINAGNKDKAKDILNSYEQINPSDADIQKLYDMLNA